MKPIRPTTPDAHADHFARCYRICVELLPDVWSRLGWTPASRSHGLDILHCADVLTGAVMRVGTSIAEGRVTEGLDDLTASIGRVRELDSILWETRGQTCEELNALLVKNRNNVPRETAERYAGSCDGRRLAVAVKRDLESMR
jgi:hypothetical protein